MADNDEKTRKRGESKTARKRMKEDEKIKETGATKRRNTKRA